MKVDADAYIADKVAMGKTTKDDNAQDSFPLILETSTVVSENLRETGETGGGSKECKAGSGSGWNSGLNKS